MKKNINFFKSILLLNLFLGFLSCSNTANDSPPEQQPAPINSVVFTVIGDVPYGNTQREGLLTMIKKHNSITSSEFVVHVGDIKPGVDPCEENIYLDVSSILKTFKVPTFMLLGDNEYNDCADPNQALIYWKQYFLKFNENWDFSQKIKYQPERPENFSWVQEKILFIGLNIVGSKVHDEVEWTNRLTDDANFVTSQVELHKNDIKTVIIFAHANMVEGGSVKFEPFTIPFRATAAAFKKPILFIQGDGHVWFKNNPWPEQNITRVQIEGGATAVQVTIDVNNAIPFTFNRTFLD